MSEKYVIYTFKDLLNHHLKIVLTLKTQFENIFL
jgi:hypothetical protein